MTYSNAGILTCTKTNGTNITRGTRTNPWPPIMPTINEIGVISDNAITLRRNNFELKCIELKSIHASFFLEKMNKIK